MISYSFLEEDPPPVQIQYVAPLLQSQESECTVILFMFIGAIIFMNLMH